MAKQSVTVFAPATVANVSCAFDVLGFALSNPGDLVTAQRAESGVSVLQITGDNGRLPREAERNTASVAVSAMLRALGRNDGIALEIHKQMPLGSGLGSSAASAVAGVVAANELLGAPLTRAELLPFAMEGERIACGSAHADNVAPSLLGGFILIRSYDPLDIVSLPYPAALHAVVVHPEIEVRTEDARRVLRKNIPLTTAVQQWGNIAGLVAGLCTQDSALIGRSLADSIIEPERAALIPGFQAVQLAARNAGALGCSISGSGPSIFALCPNNAGCAEVARTMSAAFEALGIQCSSVISAINPAGAVVQSSTGE